MEKTCNIYEELCNEKENVYYLKTFNELVESINAKKEVVDLIFFKGSHGMQLEKAVDEVFGTWYHEEFERYDHIAQTYRLDNLKYMEYSDHITILELDGSDIIDCNIPAFIKNKPVTGIERNACNGKKIRNLKLPNTLKNIRYCSFYKCDYVQDLIIPSNVRVLDKSSFSTCKNLEKVIIESGLKEIRYRAFGNCKKLKYMYIPASVVAIEPEAFIGCEKLIIHCMKNSVVDKYAKKNDISVEYIV